MSLTAETLKGMWAGLPVPWTAQDELDELALRENVRRICQAGAHGVYTHGTTGEFYAQTEQEWKRVALATVEECRAFQTPSQVGCTDLWTGGVIRRAVYAQSIGADGVQIAFPFWLPLTDDQAVRFLKDVSSAVPEMPLIIYNTERSKKPLTVALLKRVMDAGIPLIGCKGVRSAQELTSFLGVNPGIKFFVEEDNLAPYWNQGARGSYSSLVYASPRFMLLYYQLCEQGQADASRISQTLKQLMTEFVVPRLKRGLYDTAFDRIFASVTGFLTGSLLNSRAPYDSPSQSDVNACRAWCQQHLPKFLTEI